MTGRASRVVATAADRWGETAFGWGTVLYGLILVGTVVGGLVALVSLFF